LRRERSTRKSSVSKSTNIGSKCHAPAESFPLPALYIG
jgi:hypothetical protein